MRYFLTLIFAAVAVISVEAQDVKFRVVAEDGAEIWVNRQRLAVGEIVILAEPGDWRIEARKNGYKKSVQIATILNEPNQIVKLAPLEPIYGKVNVVSEPVGADVLLEGNVIGQTPISFDNIIVGDHYLTIKKEGFTPVVKKISVEDKKVVEVNATLIKSNSGNKNVVLPITEFCDMVKVDGGFFKMGGTVEQAGLVDADEFPVHEIKLDDFYIGKYEITQAQWVEIMGTNPSDFGLGKDVNLPVNQVSYATIEKFLEKLRAKTGLNYRLPTEAEWEYAARGGRKMAMYPWGDKYARDAEGCFLANFKPYRGSYYDDMGVSTMAVKQFYPNDFGLYDMAGNVAEWTASAYSAIANVSVHDMNPSYSYNARKDDPDILKRKVVKGGSWKDVSYYLQCGVRTYEYQYESRSYIGFRCVRSYIGN